MGDIRKLYERFDDANAVPYRCPGCDCEMVKFGADSVDDPCGRCAAIEREKREREDRERQAQFAKQRRRSDWAGTLRRAGTPDHYLEVSPAMNLGDLGSWRGDPWCVVMSGPTGTLKTFTATRLLGELACETDLQCVWADASEIVESIYREMRAAPGEKAGPRYLDTLVDAGVLLIDDLAAARNDDSKAGEFVQERLGYLIRQRYNWKRPTIITTDEMLDAFAERIASRLKAGRQITMQGKDRRLA